MTQGTAVVIGATRNLGLYISRKLAERGWSVVGIGRSAPEDTHAVRFVPVDLAQAGAVDALIDLLRETSPDLIVSNAVTYGPDAPSNLDLAAVEEMFRVNTLVPYLALSGYIENAPGTNCVIINSDSIFHANRQVGPYAASKAALKILTTALADTCRVKGGAVSTLLLGPLADYRKMRDCARIAEKNDLAVEDVIKALLKKGNPFYLKESFLQFEECFRSIEYIHGLGVAANGMVCKLDGGASGSLY
jgi:NAD(P)-dependent dehydrogenase (short-subunit alcohol dehydrogenase family)